MAELFRKSDNKECREISQDAKDTATERSNLEAHEVLMITDTIPCKSCHNYATYPILGIAVCIWDARPSGL